MLCFLLLFCCTTSFFLSSYSLFLLTFFFMFTFYTYYYNNCLPAMNNGRSSFRLMVRLKMSSVRQDLCRVERNSVVWPRHEMKLLRAMLFVTLKYKQRFENYIVIHLMVVIDYIQYFVNFGNNFTFFKINTRVT